MTDHPKGVPVARTADLKKMEDISERLDRLAAELEQTTRELSSRLQAIKQRRGQDNDG